MVAVCSPKGNQHKHNILHNYSYVFISGPRVKLRKPLRSMEWPFLREQWSPSPFTTSTTTLSSGQNLRSLIQIGTTFSLSFLLNFHPTVLSPSFPTHVPPSSIHSPPFSPPPSLPLLPSLISFFPSPLLIILFAPSLPQVYSWGEGEASQCLPHAIRLGSSQLHWDEVCPHGG